MRLFYVPGASVEAGTLYAENGEKVEGVMVVSAWHENQQVVSVQITMLLEPAPELDEYKVEGVVRSMVAMEEALAQP